MKCQIYVVKSISDEVPAGYFCSGMMRGDDAWTLVIPNWLLHTSWELSLKLMQSFIITVSRLGNYDDTWNLFLKHWIFHTFLYLGFFTFLSSPFTLRGLSKTGAEGGMRRAWVCLSYCLWMSLGKINLSKLLSGSRYFVFSSHPHVHFTSSMKASVCSTWAQSPLLVLHLKCNF